MKKILMVFVLALPVVVSPLAQGGTAADQGTRLISQKQAVKAASRMVKGRVLAVTLSKGKRPVYRVKMLGEDGRIRIVLVDGITGRVGGG